MLFNSYAFAIFLPIVFFVYWLFPAKNRWIVLLLSSCYFYMSWDVKYIFLLLFTATATYLCGIAIENAEKRKTKKVYVICLLVVCLGLLGFFKYAQFLFDGLNTLLGMFAMKLHPVTMKLLLPVGISFYTFQCIGYIVDVYKGKIAAEKHWGYFTTFVTFFPSLTSGPIERTERLLPQIKGIHTFSYEKATYGLKQMVWGFFMKMVIADNLVIFVDRIYDELYTYKGFSFIIVMVLFSIQIYCDFAGYSNIVLGIAKLFDIDLMTNFKSPYFAASIKEFWSRWHISLSTWFRDYVYIPLGGNRCKKWRHYVNLLITFLLSGLWHGANITFVIWGGIHGCLQVIENFFGKGKNGLQDKFTVKRWIQILMVFILCSIAWVFFRAESIQDACYLLTHLFDGITSPITYIRKGYSDLEMLKPEFAKVCLSILLLFVFDFYNYKKDVIEAISRKSTLCRWAIYIGFTLLLLLFLPGTPAKEFIYFQF